MQGPVTAKYSHGATLGELIISSIPVLNVVPLAVGVGEAIENRQWNQLAEMAGSLVAGSAIGRGVAKYGGYGLRFTVDDIGATGVGRYQAGSVGLGIERVVPNSEVLSGGPRLLPTEGNVGTYRDLMSAGSVGDNITPHHIPSANRMALSGVSKGDGIAINM